MIYIARLILWLIVIAFISWVIHKAVNKDIRNEKLKPFIGIIIFLVIVLVPITIAKIAQIYYCWKYQPFYEIIKPLGDDFQGYYEENGGYGDFIDLINTYPKNINFLDIKYHLNRYDAKDIVRDFSIIKNNTKGHVYIRYFLDNPLSDNCINGWRPSDINMTTATHVENFLIENKCLASKVILESEVSPYKKHNNDWIEEEYPLYIPGIVLVHYTKSAIFEDRINGEVLAWRAGIGIEWDLYGAFEWWGDRLGCGPKLDVEEKLLKEVGERDGN